jgi:hypothetical protein
VALINTFARINSPGIVTSNDFTQAESVGGYPEGAKLFINKWLGQNGKLNEPQRQELLDAIRSMARGVAEEHVDISDTYRKAADAYGLNPKKIVISSGFDNDIKEMLTPEKEKPMLPTKAQAEAELRRRGLLK